MTWYYDPPADGHPVRVWDHTGTVVREVKKSPDGFAIPDDIVQVMESEVMSEGLQGGLSDRQIAILRDAVFENIERGPPP